MDSKIELFELFKEKELYMRYFRAELAKICSKNDELTLNSDALRPEKPEVPVRPVGPIVPTIR